MALDGLLYPQRVMAHAAHRRFRRVFLRFPGSAAALVLIGALPGGSPPIEAQVLAKPGWAGSGVAPEAWWKRAVLYRIEPDRFQDSDGDGKGDLPGIVERLDYIQSLGVDGILLPGSVEPDAEAFSDLIREASHRHLRTMIAVEGATNTAILSRARRFLNAGAAGIAMPHATGATDSNRDLLVAMRALVHDFPGERVLLADMTEAPSSAARATPHRGTGSGELQAGVLWRAAPLPTHKIDPAALLQVLSSNAALPSNAPRLLQLEAPPATASPSAAAYATLLLASEGAMVVDAGEEIGLDLAANHGAVMQWTPSNHTPQNTPAKVVSASGETEFGAYHPYIPPPPRGLVGGVPAAPRPAVDLSIPATLPAPDSLPGFTTGTLPSPPVSGASLNVITEDRDPRSLLNAYRQLIGLHHGYATLRNGPQEMLGHEAEGAVVWLRRSPPGSRTAANIVATVNLLDRPVTLSLEGDLQRVGVTGGHLRLLFADAASPLSGESTDHLTLPPHAALLGEIGRSTAGAGERPRRRVRR